MQLGIALTYAIYIALSIGITVWVARTLFRNGRLFLVDSFGGNVQMGDAVNQLLLVGFYLINLGFIAFYLRAGTPPRSLVDAIEYISTKIGVVMLVLGVMHFFNIFNFAKFRRKTSDKPAVVEAPVGAADAA